MTAALALIIVAVLGVGTAFGVRALISGKAESLVGAPTLPATVDPIALTGDPKAAGPCALIDLAWLRQFGQPWITTPSYPRSCRVLIATPNSGDVELFAGFTTPVSSVDGVGGEPQQLGALTIVRRHLVQGDWESYCENVLILADRTRIDIEAYGRKGFDLCALTEVGTATAASALARDGITYRPDRTAGWPITSGIPPRLFTHEHH